MKFYLTLFLTLSIAIHAIAVGDSFEIEASVKNGISVPFITHSGPGAFDNYLAMNLSFDPVRSLKERIAEKTGLVLEGRDEAHITVITPPEFKKVLSKAQNFTIEKIDEIARQMEIQKSDFDIKCVGRGRTGTGEDLRQNFYVVVESEDLLEIRKQVFKKYVEAGGEPSHFDPKSFYPHITIGFTDGDIHLSSGVFKGLNSCAFDLNVVESITR